MVCAESLAVGCFEYLTVGCVENLSVGCDAGLVNFGLDSKNLNFEYMLAIYLISDGRIVIDLIWAGSHIFRPAVVRS